MKIKEDVYVGLTEALLVNSTSSCSEVSDSGVSKLDKLRKLIKERI